MATLQRVLANRPRLEVWSSSSANVILLLLLIPLKPSIATEQAAAAGGGGAAAGVVRLAEGGAGIGAEGGAGIGIGGLSTIQKQYGWVGEFLSIFYSLP